MQAAYQGPCPARCTSTARLLGGPAGHTAPARRRKHARRTAYVSAWGRSHGLSSRGEALVCKQWSHALWLACTCGKRGAQHCRLHLTVRGSRSLRCWPAALPCIANADAHLSGGSKDASLSKVERVFPLRAPNRVDDITRIDLGIRSVPPVGQGAPASRAAAGRSEQAAANVARQARPGWDASSAL